jgi:methyl-accepting chemotaxis protein
VAQLNQTTQQNASSSEELAATSEEMSGHAERLQQTMSFFRLAGGPASTVRSPSQAVHKVLAAAKAATAPRAGKGAASKLAVASHVEPDETKFVKF